MTSLSPPPRYDVAVVGAGPGGTAAAYTLAKSGLKTLLLDKFLFPRDKTCGDGLPPRALPVLDEIGLLDDVLRIGWKLDTVQVSAPSGSTVRIPIPALPHAPPYALMIPRFTLDHLLFQNAVRAGAEFQGEVQAHHIAVEPEGVIIQATQANRALEFRARMAVVAVGASTRLLVNMGLLKEQPPSIVAARGYFDRLNTLENVLHFQFAGVRMPGYGWIFPLSLTSANIGTGFISTLHHSMPPRTALEQFLKSPAMRPLLEGAEQVGPTKGYPLRTHFAESLTVAGRTLLVGEAAGLVNPLTGDGIDYALESGRTAAQHLIRMFTDGNFSPERLWAYDQDLRMRYQKLFEFCDRVRRLGVRPRALNILVPLAAHRPALSGLLLRIVLGGVPLPPRSPVSLFVFKQIVRGK